MQLRPVTHCSLPIVNWEAGEKHHRKKRQNAGAFIQNVDRVDKIG